MSPPSLWKRVALIPPLLLSLYLLADNDEDISEDGAPRPRHMALWTALQRHPPSLRVYRALLELTLLLLGTSFALAVWSKTVGDRVVGILLFQPAQQENDPVAAGRASYHPVAALDDEDSDNDSQDEEEVPHHRHTILSEEEAMDADYDSDGEVPEPSSQIHPHAPTPAAVGGAALDSLLLILLSLFFFTLSSAEGGRYIEGMENVSKFELASRIAAPIFPLALFIAAAMRAVLPWRQRKEFWTIVSFTIGAPMYSVTFRDGFIGDILTSSVRPMQDLAFTVFYIVSGLQGWWTHSYSLDDASLPLERSWLLHTVILPACMVSPLWCRFLQNLRQSYENKQRWPYLGNAFKYFIAAEVALFGVFDPSKKQTVLWIVSFVAATLYQVWWDIFMDWELITFLPNKLPKLRSKRAYPSKLMYWTILVVNFILRFGWTLSFLPRRYLDRSGVLSNHFQGDFTTVIGPAIASAEIVRRTLWGLLRLEWEAIKECRDDKTLSAQIARCSDRAPDSSEIELQTVSETKEHDKETFVPHHISQKLPVGMRLPFELTSDMSAHSDLQILSELCLWGAAFTSLGIVAAAHRETM